MELQNQVAQIRSIAPIQALSPIYSIEKKPWYKVYRAQCMIPFPMYSIKIVYIITFIAFKIYVRIELYLVPMVYPRAFPIEYGQSQKSLQHIPGQVNAIPIAGYSYNCIYCARCNLGFSCKLHVPGHHYPNENNSNIHQFKQEQKSQKIPEKKVEQ